MAALRALKSLAEFVPRTARKIQIIFLTTCASEKYFSVASAPEGCAQSTVNPIGNEIEDFMSAQRTCTSSGSNTRWHSSPT